MLAVLILVIISIFSLSILCEIGDYSPSFTENAETKNGGEIEKGTKPTKIPDKVIMRVETDPDLIWKYEELGPVFRTAAEMALYKTLIRKATRHYTFSGSPDYCRGALHCMMAKHGCSYVVPKYTPEKLVYVRLDQSRRTTSVYDKSMYKVKCVLKNFGDISSMKFQKHELPSNPSLLKFLPRTQQLADYVWDGRIAIAKLDGSKGYGGYGNAMISCQEDLDKFKLRCAGEKISGAIVQDYIDNPLLFEGFKYHYRCYMMISSWGASLYPRHYSFTAGIPYQRGCWDQFKMHDSHLHNTPRYRYWPDGISDPRIKAGITEIYEAIVALCKGFKPYSESDYAYHVLAPDIMFDENFKPYLLEINLTPRLGSIKQPGIEEHEPAIMTWEFENGIQPVFNNL